jgi:hypothetical protein
VRDLRFMTPGVSELGIRQVCAWNPSGSCAYASQFVIVLRLDSSVYAARHPKVFSFWLRFRYETQDRRPFLIATKIVHASVEEILQDVRCEAPPSNFASHTSKRRHSTHTSLACPSQKGCCQPVGKAPAYTIAAYLWHLRSYRPGQACS